MARSCVVIGSGRAGGSFHAALTDAGWTSELIAARPLLDELAGDGSGAAAGRSETSVGESSLNASSIDALGASSGTTRQVEFDLDGVDVVLLAVPDDAIADVARVLPATDAVVAHVSGACGLDVLAPNRRVGSIHPLMSLPDVATGSRRLLDSCTFAVDGDPLLSEVVAALGGRAIEVPASKRSLYHATASVAANHLTALCGHVESLAEQVGVPVDAYWTLMRTTLDNIEAVGPAEALTGPAARADWGTVRAHLDALPTDEDRQLYRTLCAAAARLAGRPVPEWLVDS